MHTNAKILVIIIIIIYTNEGFYIGISFFVHLYCYNTKRNTVISIISEEKYH